ncbi:MAG: IPTL-CTERM sorting domain-containing protein [Pseudomonadota bacterium]|nr:IPTL-CTERM sorting domain-containing protein [Pseudomonadota bacterium]
MNPSTIGTIQWLAGKTRLVTTALGFRRHDSRLFEQLAFLVLLSISSTTTVLAATAPGLGTATSFAVVSSTFTNSNTAPRTIITGDVCFTTGPVTPPLSITGAVVTPCAPTSGADQSLALVNLTGQVCTSLGAGAVALDTVVIGTNPPGVLPPGCYSSGGAMTITASSTVTLNGAGVYIFRPGGALTTGANSSVALVAGACAADVFWAPVGAATLGANASPSVAPTFSGNILDAAGITIGHFANVTGRVLAFGGTVTTDADTITVPTCTPFSGGGGGGGAGGNAGVNTTVSTAIPTLSEWGTFLLATLLLIAGWGALRRQTTSRGANQPR